MADKKKSFYAVVKGRKPGIYTYWTGAGGAEEQVKGFAGAFFKGFFSRDQAEAFIKAGGKEEQDGLFETPPIPVVRRAEPSAGGQTPVREAPKADLGSRTDGRPSGWDAYLADLQAGKTVIFTDGASTNNPGPGGYGVVLLSGETRTERSGGFRRTTNNRMELMGVIVGLQSLAQRSKVVIYSDSSYVVQGVEKGWARRWRANNWMRAPGTDGVAKPAENKDLWSTLLDLLEQHQVELRWVRGHASHPENERCDQLAVQAAHGSALPVDEGYQAKR